MRFIRVDGQQHQVLMNTALLVDLTLDTPANGHIVDVGLSNEDVRLEVWCAQFYIYERTKARLTVVNMNPATATIAMTLVVAVDYTDDLPASPEDTLPVVDVRTEVLDISAV